MIRQLLSCIILGGLLYLCACNQTENFADQCPPCPNNTECLEGDCGCPEDKHDMGSWCLQKHDNLFVAASLDCYCIDVAGLYLWNITPKNGSGGGVHIPQSSFSFVGRGNSRSSGTGNFDYYDLPDGDSIVIYNVPMPNEQWYANDCRINSNLICAADIFGKFHGPDTIQAQVVWQRCQDNDGNWLSYREVKPLTFIRKR
jgi:hypothetical protein